MWGCVGGVTSHSFSFYSRELCRTGAVRCWRLADRRQPNDRKETEMTEEQMGQVMAEINGTRAEIRRILELLWVSGDAAGVDVWDFMAGTVMAMMCDSGGNWGQVMAAVEGTADRLQGVAGEVALLEPEEGRKVSDN